MALVKDKWPEWLLSFLSPGMKIGLYTFPCRCAMYNFHSTLFKKYNDLYSTNFQKEFEAKYKSIIYVKFHVDLVVCPEIFLVEKGTLCPISFSNTTLHKEYSKAWLFVLTWNCAKPHQLYPSRKTRFPHFILSH